MKPSLRLTAIALSTALALSAIPPKQASANTLILMPVGAIAATLVVVGGISMWLVTYSNGEQAYFNYEDLLPWTEDPEGVSEEWSDYIWADDPVQAEQRCRQYAETNGVIFVRVRRTSQAGSRYECTVRTYS